MLSNLTFTLFLMRLVAYGAVIIALTLICIVLLILWCKLLYACISKVLDWLSIDDNGALVPVNIMIGIFTFIVLIGYSLYGFGYFHPDLSLAICKAIDPSYHHQSSITQEIR